MQDWNLFERLLAWLVLPATLFGAGGALIHSCHDHRPLKQKMVEIVGGVITANMVMPLVQDYTPENWHYTMFFLVGWGGVQLIDRFYNTVISALEKRIRKQINPGSDSREE